MSYRDHLRGASDLVTPQADTRAGFIAMAVERSLRAVPYVGEARALKVATANVAEPKDLLPISAIRAGLVYAAGISDKASGHMLDEDKTVAICELITNHLETAGAAFQEELVYRFLLTRGDSLGGSMRNITGSLAGRKLTRAIISALNLAGVPYSWRHRTEGGWVSGTPEDAGIEASVRALSWSANRGPRLLAFNCGVPMIRKNVDLCLLAAESGTYDDALKDPRAYVALGELKGGIDPAGADEHWKTASKAFTRIRKGFAGLAQNRPATFFIGAAIVEGMAAEIWGELQDGTLTSAANMTNPDQLASICSWLVSL